MTKSNGDRRRPPSRLQDKEQTRNDRLRTILRKGDPARDDAAPSAAEFAAMRQRITDTARSSGSVGWLPIPAAASALIAVLLIAAAASYWFTFVSTNDGSLMAHRTAVDRHTLDAGIAAAHNGQATRFDEGVPPSVRKVQFITESGTRIVWVLNRDLDI